MAQHEPIDWSKDKEFTQKIDSIIEQIRKFSEKILPKTSIYKVPSKQTVKDISSPHFVSIGPIHGGQFDLLAMEEMKLWYSMFFFYRSRNPAITLQECGEAIINFHENVPEYYAYDLKTFDKYKLMKLLLVDGCFLLELFLRHSGEREYTFLKEKKIDIYGEIKETSNDLILGNHWMRNAVCRDLVLLENQIPLVVLEMLLSKIEPYNLKCRNGVKDYTLNFFSANQNYTRIATSICIDEEEPRHILEVLHKKMLPSWKLENGKKIHGLMHCVTELLESGVNIKMKKLDLSNETDNFNSKLLEIEFDNDKGVLKIPQFWIGGTTSLITKNLVAFEQCSFGMSQSHHVTAYVLFMKCLIRSEKDARLLKRKGIIKQHPGSDSDQNVSEFFKDCCDGVALKDFYYSQVCEKVEEYRKNWMHFYSYVTCFQSRGRKYKGVLEGQYCPDACRTIAFLAATALLLVTFLQTFYTVYPYYKK